jgi:hypothetical protein
MRLDAWRSDWRALVDPDTFNIRDGRYCVAGQIATALDVAPELCSYCAGVDADDCGECCYCPDMSDWYCAGLHAVGLDSYDGRDCGFDRRWNDGVTYDMLDAAWRAVITNNR